MINSDSESDYGRFFEEFEVNKTYRHWPGKTITESDNNLFCLLTMNHHPVHLDKEYASEKQHGQILVVGTLVFSLVVGMTVRDISGKAIANLEYNQIKHLNPVFIGDTLYAETKILDKKESSTKADRGIITVETNAYNQKDEPVLRFQRKISIPKKDTT